jgi:hypothetical protein
MTLGNVNELKCFSEDTTKRIYEVILNEKYNQELIIKKKEKESLKSFLCRVFLFKRKQIYEYEPTLYTIKPDNHLQAGKVLPKSYWKYIKPELVGRPLEELDDFYKNDHVIHKNVDS